MVSTLQNQGDKNLFRKDKSRDQQSMYRFSSTNDSIQNPRDTANARDSANPRDTNKSKETSTNDSIQNSRDTANARDSANPRDTNKSKETNKSRVDSTFTRVSHKRNKSSLLLEGEISELDNEIKVIGSLLTEVIQNSKREK